MTTDRVELSKLLIYNVFIQKDEILCAERKNVLVSSSNRKMSEFFCVDIVIQSHVIEIKKALDSWKRLCFNRLKLMFNIVSGSQRFV